MLSLKCLVLNPEGLYSAHAPSTSTVHVQYSGPSSGEAAYVLYGVAGCWVWPEKALGCNSRMSLCHLDHHGTIISYPCPGSRVQSYFGFWWPYHQQTISAGSQVPTICAVFVSKELFGTLITQLAVPPGLLVLYLARWFTFSWKSLWIICVNSLNGRTRITTFMIKNHTVLPTFL